MITGPSLSGATLWVAGHSVHKVATGLGARRLEIAANRQTSFRSHAATNVRAAKVLEITASEGRTHVEMEHIGGVGLAIMCPNWLDHVKVVIDFVEKQLATAQEGRVPLNSLFNKIEATRINVRARHGGHPLFEEGFQITAVLADEARLVSVPFGYYHGDLTLCNILCDCVKNPPRGIVLIDFLDMIFATPIFDIVKMRQDTHRDWIALFMPEVDPSRLVIADELVVEAFAHCEWWVKWYPVFDLLNLLRLIPYAPPGRVLDWITAELERLLG